MSERKTEIKRKINNVKEWLDSADDNFQQDHEVKGQLNLLMAQAEMQTLKKANLKWYEKYRIHISLGLLILVIVLGVVYNSFTKDKRVDTIIKSNSQSYEKTKNNIDNENVGIDKRQERNNTSEFAAPKALEEPQSNATHTLTETEKRELVRKAQQSLHGELKR